MREPLLSYASRRRKCNKREALLWGERDPASRSDSFLRASPSAEAIWHSNYFADVPPNCLAAAAACSTNGAAAAASIAVASTVAVAMSKRAVGPEAKVAPVEQHAIGIAAGLVTWIAGGAPADVSIAASEAAAACGADEDWSRMIGYHATLACSAAATTGSAREERTGRPSIQANPKEEASSLDSPLDPAGVLGLAQLRFSRWQGPAAVRGTREEVRAAMAAAPGSLPSMAAPAEGLRHPRLLAPCMLKARLLGQGGLVSAMDAALLAHLESERAGTLSGQMEALSGFIPPPPLQHTVLTPVPPP